MKQAGQQLGVSADTICNWEQDRGVPALHLRPAIIEYLGYDPTPAPETIAERLRHHRLLRGWTQKKLAQRLEVDPTTLARWERAERQPTGKHQQVVEAILDPTHLIFKPGALDS